MKTRFFFFFKKKVSIAERGFEGREAAWEGQRAGGEAGAPPARGPAPTWGRTKERSTRGGGAGGPRACGGRLPGSPRLPPRLRLPGPAATKMARSPGCGLADESRRRRPAGTASRSGQVEAAAEGGSGQLLAGARARLGPRPRSWPRAGHGAGRERATRRCGLQAGLARSPLVAMETTSSRAGRGPAPEVA